MQDPNAKKRLYSSIIKVVILLGLVVVYLIFTRLTGWGIPCVFHKVTGLHCPGCGVTRMLGVMLQLDFYRAFRYNMFAFCMLPFAIFFGVRHWLRWVKTGTNPSNRVETIVVVTALVLALLFGIMRNLPWFAFLAPT